MHRARDAGEDLVEPRCFYVEGCGGCTWQEIDYERQLAWKREEVALALEAAGFGPDEVPLREVVPSPRTYDFRNKMEFTFSDRRWLTRAEIEGGEDLRRDFALGMFGPRTFYKVIDIATCPIQSERANGVLAAARVWALERGHQPFRADRREGLLRFLILRHAEPTGQLLVVLVTSQRDPAVMADLLAWLEEAGVAPTTLANGVTDTHQYSTGGMVLHVDHGPERLEDELSGLRYELAPDAFFQVNPTAAERLVELTLERADLSGSERVLDLYCGAGTLSLPLAQRAGHVHGLEVIEPAVASARRNAELNGLTNLSFGVADLNAGFSAALAASADAGAPVDVVVTDPPRPGMHKQTLRDLSRLAPARIVSIGCKPGPHAENLRWLCREGGYRVSEVQPLDLFPHTPHVETVALLERVG